jgi:ligand-binding sensor domain-containing protein
MANVTKDINMRFKDVRQGLSHQTVNCFYQDEFGFLWIGTQDGLNRFDGRKFEVFKPDNANPYSININNIRQVCGNKAGLLFIRSLQSVTLYDMRLNRFRVYFRFLHKVHLP